MVWNGRRPGAGWFGCASGRQRAEAGAAVLQHEATLVDDHTGAEEGVVGADERDRRRAVGHGHVGGPARHGQCLSRWRRGVVVERRPDRRRPSGVGQAPDRAARVRIADARRRFGERGLDRFGLAVHAARRQQLVTRVVVGEDAERADDDGAVTVGWQLDDFPVGVARGGKGLDPFAVVRGDVGRRHRAPVRGRGAHDGLGGPPLVEVARAVGGDRLERPRLRRVGEPLPRHRRGAAGEEHLVRVGRELARFGGPLVRLFDPEWEAGAGETDRRLQARGQIQPPEPAVELAPRLHQTRHGHRRAAGPRHRAVGWHEPGGSAPEPL